MQQSLNDIITDTCTGVSNTTSWPIITLTSRESWYVAGETCAMAPPSAVGDSYRMAAWSRWERRAIRYCTHGLALCKGQFQDWKRGCAYSTDALGFSLVSLTATKTGSGLLRILLPKNKMPVKNLIRPTNTTGRFWGMFLYQSWSYASLQTWTIDMRNNIMETIWMQEYWPVHCRSKHRRPPGRCNSSVHCSAAHMTLSQPAWGCSSPGHQPVYKQKTAQQTRHCDSQSS